MVKYKYTITTKDGKTVSGEMSGDTMTDIVIKLIGDGKYDVDTCESITFGRIE